jgi:hypothetical protein
MSDENPQDYRPIAPEELSELAGEELPERAAMSLLNANVAAPVNLAAALNVASDHSTAFATAAQTAPNSQSNGAPAPTTQMPVDPLPPTTA